MSVRTISLKREPERIALIKPSALGDIVHSLPVLTALRRQFPAAQIAWIVNRAYAPLLHGHPDLSEIIPFDRGAMRAGLITGGMSFARFLHDLRKRRFDLVIDLQGLLRHRVDDDGDACAGAHRFGVGARGRACATPIVWMIAPT